MTKMNDAMLIYLLWYEYICLILQVDGINLQGFTNQQAVEVLRHTGQTVRLTLIRKCLKQENHLLPRENVSTAIEKDLSLQTMDIGTGKGVALLQMGRILFSLLQQVKLE